MAMHIFNTRKLVVQLAQEKIRGKDAFHYLLANILLWTSFLYYGYIFGEPFSWLFILKLIIVLLISIFGLTKAFEANGGDQGHDFVLRAICLSVPVGIKVGCLSIMFSWGTYLLFPVIIDPATFRDPGRIYGLLMFIWAPSFTGLFYWRLVANFRVIAHRSVKPC